jgi:hypothetical protein
VYPPQDLFGVSFSLFYDRTDIIDVGSGVYVKKGTFFGTECIMIVNVVDDHGDGRGRIDIGISRKAGDPGVSGYGSLVRIKFVASGTATDVIFQTSDVGHLISAYNSHGLPITIAGWSNRVNIIEPEPPMEIWPGDTNNDGVVDTTDIFPIAMYFGNEGAVRPGATLIWTGQPIDTPWTPVDATYADANGDGVVNAADVLAVGINFGCTHTVTSGGSLAPALNSIDYAKYVEAFRQMYKVLEATGMEIKAAPELKQVLAEAIEIGIEQKEACTRPAETVLLQNYPNPFNPECWIPYELAEPGHVVIRIYNISGELIRTLDLGVKEAGAYTTRSRAAYWDGKNEAGEEVASGVYFYQLQVGDKVMTKRMVVVK